MLPDCLFPYALGGTIQPKTIIHPKTLFIKDASWITLPRKVQHSAPCEYHQGLEGPEEETAGPR